MAEAPLLARVLVDSALPQLDHLFDYTVPAALQEQAVPGVRVTVPLRNATAQGYLVELGPQEHFAGALAAIDTIVSPLPVLDPEVYALARRVADRAAGNASDVLRLAIPKRQVRVEKAEIAAASDASTSTSTSTSTPTAPPSAAPAGGAPLPVEARPGITGYSPELAEQLDAGGRIALAAIARLETVPGGSWVGHWAITLAEAAARVVAAGRSAILVAPDYRDLDQIELAVRALLPETGVARMDARQSGPDRYRAFLDARTGRARVIIGNRSAVYAPAQDLGLIALWDDGDPLFAEQLAPYTHARDAALIRQEQQGTALILAGHTRSTEVQRLVELGHLRAVDPAPAYRPRVVLAGRTAEEQQGQRIPSSVWQGASAALAEGPVLVQVARPVTKPSAAGSPAEEVPGAPDVARTAHELGLAFPRVAIVQSHGDKPVQELAERPALVVATRGAEPIVPGGYRAVLLLDARRMLSRESLRVAEDCLRWWSNAAALAAPRAPVYLVGVSGTIGERLATWRQDEFAAGELADRRLLRFPPAARHVVIEGSAPEVSAAIEEVRAEANVEVHWPEGIGEGKVRGALRFDYRYGGQVAQILRTAILRNASGRRPGGRRGPVLRVRFDDKDFFAS